MLSRVARNASAATRIASVLTAGAANGIEAFDFSSRGPDTLKGLTHGGRSAAGKISFHVQDVRRIEGLGKADPGKQQDSRDGEQADDSQKGFIHSALSWWSFPNRT
jgi:hypothetical protein